MKDLVEHAASIINENKLISSGGERLANLTHTPQDDYSSFFNLFGETQLIYPQLDQGWKFEWISRDALQSEDAAGSIRILFATSLR